MSGQNRLMISESMEYGCTPEELAAKLLNANELAVEEQNENEKEED